MKCVDGKTMINITKEMVFKIELPLSKVAMIKKLKEK